MNNVHGIFHDFKKIGHLKQENGSSANRCVQFKTLFTETHLQIKFGDGSVKQNILIACTGLALAPLTCLKWSIKKNQGRFHGRCTVFFLCVFVLGHFKEEMGSGERFSVI